MKKIIASAAILAISLCMFGCTKTIAGSVSTVVEECQELSTDAKVKIEVSGGMSPFLNISKDDMDGCMVMLSSDDDGSTKFVNAFFDELSEDDVRELNSGRVTISGDLQADSTRDASITIDNCKLK